jgi:predicted nucleic acid-binding protein
MGPPGKLERDACRMAADLPWQISRDLVLKWAEVMVAVRRTGHRIETADAWIGAKRA